MTGTLAQQQLSRWVAVLVVALSLLAMHDLNSGHTTGPAASSAVQGSAATNAHPGHRHSSVPATDVAGSMTQAPAPGPSTTAAPAPAASTGTSC